MPRQDRLCGWRADRDPNEAGMAGGETMILTYSCHDCHSTARCDSHLETTPPKGWAYIEAIDGKGYWLCDSCAELWEKRSGV